MSGDEARGFQRPLAVIPSADLAGRGEPLFDRFGSELTTDSASAVEALDRTVRALAAHRHDTASHLAAALEADDGLTVAWCLRGFALSFVARRDLRESAAEALASARAALAARGGTEREYRLTAALSALIAGDSAMAVRELSIILAEKPADLLALKLEHAVRFMRGDSAGMRNSAERALPSWSEDDPGYGYACGILAFAREETGDYEGAERAAREGLAHAPDDAWGAHALAHVYEMQDRPLEGRGWLERCYARGTFDACNNFGGHVAWHLALFCVQLGDYERALELYDDIVRHPPGDFRDVSNASSLLFRLEDEGVSVGARWRALAERVLPFAHDHGYAFADVHYALTLMRAGERAEARALLASLRKHALADRSPDTRVLRERGLPLVEGTIALEDGRFGEAFELLAHARRGASELGGSHAQRDLFRRLWIAAARCTGEPAKITESIRAYLAVRPASRWPLDGSARVVAPAE